MKPNKSTVLLMLIIICLFTIGGIQGAIEHKVALNQAMLDSTVTGRPQHIIMRNGHWLCWDSEKPLPPGTIYEQTITKSEGEDK